MANIGNWKLELIARDGGVLKSLYFENTDKRHIQANVHSVEREGRSRQFKGQLIPIGWSTFRILKADPKKRGKR